MLFEKKTNNSQQNQPLQDKKIDEAYVEEKISKIDDGDVEILMDNEEEISKKISGSNSLAKYKELGKLMIAMVKDVKRGAYPNVPWFTIATVVMTLLYVLNPLDIIPDFIPGIGYVDDLAILSIGMGWIESDLHRYLDWKISEGNKA